MKVCMCVCVCVFECIREYVTVCVCLYKTVLNESLHLLWKAAFVWLCVCVNVYCCMCVLCVLPWLPQHHIFPYQSSREPQTAIHLSPQPLSVCECVWPPDEPASDCCAPSSLCNTHTLICIHVWRRTCYKTYSMYEHDDTHTLTHTQQYEGDVCLMGSSSF